jgi:CHAT domain-containing protein/Tfp pilus assembly protein PilF
LRGGDGLTFPAFIHINHRRGGLMRIRAPLWGTVLGIISGLIFVGDRSRPIFSDSFERAIIDAEQEASSGHFESALILFQSALSYARKEGKIKEQANCLIRSAIMAWNLGKIPDTIKLFEGARDLFPRQQGPQRIYCEAALRISDLYQQAKSRRDAGDFDQSIALFLQSITLSRSIQSPELEVKCLRQMSICYWEKNELEHYFELNRTAREIAHGLCHHREEGICLNNMGIFFSFSNDYSKALDCFDRALSFFKIDGTSENISNCLNNIAILYTKFSEYEKAIDNIEMALAIDEKSHNNANICMDLNNLGLFYKNKGTNSLRGADCNSAIAHLFRSLEIAEKLQLKKMIIKINNNIGETLFEIHDYRGALKYFNTAMFYSKSSTDINEACSIANNVGNCYLKDGQYFYAENLYKLTLKNEAQISNSEILQEAYFGLGQCYEKWNRDEQALSCYKKCVTIIDFIRARIHIDTFKAGFARAKLEVFQSLLNLLVKMRKGNSAAAIEEEIFLYIEKAKARAFFESLVESRVDVTNRLDPKLKAEEAKISRRISSLTTSLSNRIPDLPNKKMLLAELAREEEAYMRLSSRMRTADPALANLILPEISTVQEIRSRLLGKDDVLIEYFLAEPVSFLAVIEKERMSVHLLPSKTVLVDSVKGFIKFVSGRNPVSGDIRPAARRIFQEILFPLRESWLGSKKKLIIVPDGILYFLPFEALIDESWRGGNQYLIEHYEISYMPSATTLKWLAASPASKNPAEGLLALGDPDYVKRGDGEEGSLPGLGISRVLDDAFDPLPKSRQEIRTVAQYFPRRKQKIFLGPEAREEILKNADGHHFSIIHLACHSYIDESHPFRSALILAVPRKGGEDGLLQVRELYNLKLPADLVVLSACRTARGRMDSWEGVLGMPRIFFYTGARSVVSTLWPIEDRSAAFFMDRFYGGMSRGLSVSKSLQRAKIDLIHLGYADPHYWAPFILNGESRLMINMGN